MIATKRIKPDDLPRPFAGNVVDVGKEVEVADVVGLVRFTEIEVIRQVDVRHLVAVPSEVPFNVRPEIKRLLLGAGQRAGVQPKASQGLTGDEVGTVEPLSPDVVGRGKDCKGSKVCSSKCRKITVRRQKASDFQDQFFGQYVERHFVEGLQFYV